MRNGNWWARRFEPQITCFACLPELPLKGACLAILWSLPACLTLVWNWFVSCLWGSHLSYASIHKTYLSTYKMPKNLRIIDFIRNKFAKQMNNSQQKVNRNIYITANICKINKWISNIIPFNVCSISFWYSWYATIKLNQINSVNFFWPIKYYRQFFHSSFKMYVSMSNVVFVVKTN